MLCFDSEKMNWYYHVLARRPYFVVVFLSVFCFACIVVSLIINKLPDFRDPTLGFETRGTPIGNRLTAWNNLCQETKGSGSLVADPKEFLPHQYKNYDHKPKRKNRRKHKNKRRKQKNRILHNKTNEDLMQRMLVIHSRLKATRRPGINYHPSDESADWSGDNGVFRDYEVTNESSLTDMEPTKHSEREHFEYGHNTTSVDETLHREKIQTKKSTWRILKQAASLPTSTWGDEDEIRQPTEGFFCDSPHRDYSHFVVQRIQPNATDSLFDLNGLLAMCQLQDQIAAVPSYEQYCLREMGTDNFCRPWSLPNYAALLANKSSCFDLTTNDVVLLQNLLLTCFEYFHDLRLSNDCNEHSPCYAPAECTRHSLVFNILHFLTDYSFIKPNDTNVYLRYSMIFVPVDHSHTKILPLFHEWEKADLKNDLVHVVAMDLDLENELFNELLLSDVWLVSLGGVFVMACMWLYTSSAFITFMSCIAVCFSLGLAYFVYTLVFELSFFPYMNLLAVVVIIGIGADDVFLFVKIWQCVIAERFSKSSAATSQVTLDVEHTESLQNLMALTMRHAAASMFVTSLTTAGAFYASYISSITAIKCFGIFAGTVVITNYLLMITWLPASVSIMERISMGSATCNQLQIQKLILACNKSINKFCQFFENAIVDSIMTYAYFWLMIFGAIGISSAVIVFYWPGLQLPQNEHFQLFVSEHPFEIYSSKLKNEFWFEKTMSTYENYKMPLRFVWGIHPVDDGDYMNPSAHGNLHYDNNFNISTKAAQVWLLDFCRDLRQQEFYQHTIGVLLPNCFIENFIDFMKRRCVDDMDRARTDRTPCCDAKFPYEPHIFELCLPQSISDLYATPLQYFIPGVAGPKFASPVAETEVSAELLASNETHDMSFYNDTPTPAIVKALVIEFESDVSYTTNYKDVHNFFTTVEHWFQQSLTTAPEGLQGGWFISELKFYNVQDTLSRDTLIAITLAMSASLIVLLFVTFNVLISIYAVVTVSFTIFTTVAVLILLGWKLNILESIAVSTAIGLAVDFSLHYSIHYRLSPTKERIAATQFALSRIIGPTVMAASTTGFAGGIMMASNILPYIQIGIFLVVVMLISWFYATFFLMSLLRIAGPQYNFMQFRCPKMGKHSNANGHKYYERKPSQVIASEQLLTPSSSAMGELINSETHELESLNSNTIIKTISGNADSANLHVSSAKANADEYQQQHSSSFQTTEKYLDDDTVSVTVPLHQSNCVTIVMIASKYQQDPSACSSKSSNMELPAANAKHF